MVIFVVCIGVCGIVSGVFNMCWVCCCEERGVDLAKCIYYGCSFIVFFMK